MTGSYLIMDGGLRDARAGGMPDPTHPRAIEALELIQQEGKRRMRLQPLIDER